MEVEGCMNLKSKSKKQAWTMWFCIGNISLTSTPSFLLLSAAKSKTVEFVLLSPHGVASSIFFNCNVFLPECIAFQIMKPGLPACQLRSPSSAVEEPGLSPKQSWKHFIRPVRCFFQCLSTQLVPSIGAEGAEHRTQRDERSPKAGTLRDGLLEGRGSERFASRKLESWPTFTRIIV